MMSPSRYKKIAVASTFSPRFKQVLAEAKRIRDRFGAELSLIYVGERTEETTRKFKEAFAELELPADSIVHYGTGHPAEAILEAASNVDLVIAGALEKEVVLRPFLGDTGFAASDFVQSVEADLLVVPVPIDTTAADKLPTNIAWITDVIPCNLWVIR